ncbi:MAG: hypothetical protein ACM3U2_05840 [Deltaproteobacteria bacterium]
MHDDKIAQIYAARQLQDAQFLGNMLADAGIEARIVGEPLNMVGPPANLQSAALWVRREDAERAARVIGEWEKSQARTRSVPGRNATWTCSACGELVEEDFDLCWNCQEPRRAGPTAPAETD